MRWFTLPVSVAAHATALAGFLFVPLAIDVDMPSPWPVGSLARQYVVAAAAVPEIPGPLSRTPPEQYSPFPIHQPDSISDTEPAVPPGVEIEGGVPFDGIGVNVGAPDAARIVVPPPPPPPAPPRPSIVRPGGMIREPKKIVDVRPVYPEVARQAKIEGLVIVEAIIDERGMVAETRVLRSQPLLDGAALAALRQWRYTPTLLNGVPVRVLMTITFNFALGDRVP